MPNGAAVAGLNFEGFTAGTDSAGGSARGGATFLTVGVSSAAAASAASASAAAAAAFTLRS